MYPHVSHSCPIKIVWNPQWYPIQSRVPLQFSDTPRIILISSWLLTIHVPSNIQLKPIKLMPKQSIFRAHPKKNHLAAVHIRDEYHHHSTYIYIHIYIHTYIYSRTYIYNTSYMGIIFSLIYATWWWPALLYVHIDLSDMPCTIPWVFPSQVAEAPVRWECGRSTQGSAFFEGPYNNQHVNI